MVQLTRTPKKATKYLSPFSVEVVLKVREIMKLIERDGWYLDRVRSSHRQYKHPTKPGLVTVPGKPADDLPPGTLGSILRQAGLKGKLP
jgi:predicted RNA binding protein YcfA (HicA-like mRNA interferase family)